MKQMFVSLYLSSSSPGALENEESPFIAITPWSTRIRIGSTCYGHIYGLNRTSDLGVALNCIWCRVSSYEALGSEAYAFIVITSRASLIRGSCTYQGPIYGSKTNI